MPIELRRKDLEMLIPHRQDALLLDGILFDQNNGSSITGIKKVSQNESYFSGHFPAKPIFPGHFMIECINLTAAILVKLRFPKVDGLPVIVQIEGPIKFRNLVVPGDQMLIEVDLIENKLNKLFKFNGQITKSPNTLVCEVFGIKGIAYKK